MYNQVLAIIVFITLTACQVHVESGAPPNTLEVVPDTLGYQIKIPNRGILYDKILGSLTGSAIGDAMGAPTEMWSRQDRERSFGYVDTLDKAFIDPSPEGIWDFHLPVGTTTDDTRWKLLVGTFINSETNLFYQLNGPDPFHFASYILSSYEKEVENLKRVSATDPAAIDYKIRRLTWLQEWAMVAKPFIKEDLEGYTTALHRFYGGDLLCAGMLYAPALGLPYPGHPLKAYNAAHRLGIFDQGYARDITGLTAAMVSAAMPASATSESILKVFEDIDPHDYFRSRLFGREAFKTLQAANFIAKESKTNPDCSEVADINQLNACHQRQAFEMLDQRNQQSPAHAQEILLVTLTGMIFSDFEFQETMEFITNYGRDNDTSGAVAGAILGAYVGFEKLPVSLRDPVLETNKVNLGIDLEKLAAEITDNIIKFAGGQEKVL